MSGFYWLASYPKSGNTWLRIFFANLRREAGGPVDINHLSTGRIASSRELFDDVAGIESSDLLPEEIESLRPRVFRELARRSSRPLFFKIHDAYTVTSAGEPLVPADVTFGAIYVLRNPLDVAVSFAHHDGCSLDVMIDRMSDGELCWCADPRRLSIPLPQRLLSWSGHVRSWLGADALQVHRLRYEDMSLEPEKAFAGAAAFANLPTDPGRIRTAIAASSFRELARQEAAHGFRERSRPGASFFRRGEVGSWRDVLSDAQADRILEDHGAVMREAGYLDDAGSPVY